MSKIIKNHIEKIAENFSKNNNNNFNDFDDFKENLNLNLSLEKIKFL